VGSSPAAGHPAADGQQPAEQQAERAGRLPQQLHHDARLPARRLPVGRPQGGGVIPVQEEQGGAARHRLEHLRRGGDVFYLR